MSALTSERLSELLARLLQATRSFAYVAQLDDETGSLQGFSVAEPERVQSLLPLAPGRSFEESLAPDDQHQRREAFRTGERAVQTRFRCTDANGTVHWLHEEAIVEAGRVVGILSLLPAPAQAAVAEPLAPLAALPADDPLAAPRPTRARMLRASSKATSSADLEQALEENQFALAYQFQLEPETRLMTAAEVFVRWRHPSQGLLFPSRFLQKAEESGLIIPLGNWVIKAACQQQQEWRQRGYFLPLIFNLTTDQLTSPGFVEHLPEAAIRLELPESAIALHGERLAPYLQSLEERGFVTGLDNAGLTPLTDSLLETLPVRFLKLSRTIVQGLDVPETAQKARQTLLQAHRHGLQLIAEGVETPEQAQWLLATGCQVLQGYFYSRPLSGEALEEILRAGSYQLPDSPVALLKKAA